MSTKAVTIIGCEVNQDMLAQRIKTRMCKRRRYQEDGTTPRVETDIEGCMLEESGIDYDSYGSDFQVCPFCIIPPYQFDYNVIYNTDDFTISGEFKGEDVSLSVIRSRLDESAKWFVGIVSGEADETTSTSLTAEERNISLMHSKVKAVLEPLGLWREHGFGVHTVLVVR